MTDFIYSIDDDGFLLSAVRRAFVGAGIAVQRAVDTPPPDNLPPPGFAWRWVGSAWELTQRAIPAKEPAEPEGRAPAYVERRRANYPPVSAQLDMLWHAMERGEIPMAEDFYNTIAAVKEAFPKDGAGDFVFEVGKMPED